MTKKGAIIVSVINFDMYEIWKSKIFFEIAKKPKSAILKIFKP